MNARGDDETVQELARKLIHLEASVAGIAKPNLTAAGLVCESIRLPLCALTGTAGVRALMSRALSLAKRRMPQLAPVRVGPNGVLQGLAELPEDDAEAGLALVSELVGLLSVLIGENLTHVIMAGVWPSLKDVPTGSSGVEQP